MASSLSPPPPPTIQPPIRYSCDLRLPHPIIVSIRRCRQLASRGIGSSRYSRSDTKHCPIFARSTPLMDHAPKKAGPGSMVPTVVDVDLGNRSYPIYIGSGLLDEPELLQRHVKGKRVLVVTNATIAPLYLEKVTEVLTVGNPNVSVDSVILPDGEKYKNMETLMKVFDKAIETRLDRRCTFVALGGGVIGDMCGFAAAAFLRGQSDPKQRAKKRGGTKRKTEEMEEAQGVVKHVLLAKFKDDVSPERAEELIKGYAGLVQLIEPMKAFHWGTDVSKENMHQGFTHVFESTFQSVEGVEEYVSHPAHVEFADQFLSALEKVIVIDYKPTTVRL